MVRAMMTAASGMKVQEMQVDTIANNIANVNTAAFKKNELAFREMLYETLKEPGAKTAANSMSPTGLQVGSGAEVASSVKIMRQGELQPTSSTSTISTWATAPMGWRLQLKVISTSGQSSSIWRRWL